MTEQDLIARLREFDPYTHELEVVDEAADRIEALGKACTEWAEVSQSNYQRAKTSEAKLAKAVAFIRRHIPDSVYEQRRRANAFLAELEKTE